MKFPFERAISELSTIILKFFEKNFNGEDFSKIDVKFSEILTDFQSENGFEFTKYRRINVLAISWGSCKYAITPPPNYNCKMKNFSL